MENKKLFWWIFPPFFIVSLIAFIAVIIFTRYALYDFNTVRHTESLTKIFNTFLELKYQSRTNLNTFFVDSRIISKSADLRVTIINLEGKVVLDTHEDISRLGPHYDRPEFIKANMEGGVSTSIRFSETLKKSLLYVAKKVSIQGKDYVVRVAQPVAEFQSEMLPFIKLHRNIILGALFLITFISWFIAKRVSLPIENLTTRLREKIELNEPLNLTMSGSLEVQKLVNVLNSQTSRISDTINELLFNKRQQESIFSSMKEGIIALDEENYVYVMNDAAKDFISCRDNKPKGKKLIEVSRDLNIIKLIDKLRESDDEIEFEYEILEPVKKVIQLKAATIVSSEISEIKKLVVLHDITNIHKLESMRKQFVANVSHELKTPLTSIISYVETLGGNATIDESTRERFLKIIEHNSYRLKALIEDLLTLSKLEQSELNMKDVQTISVKRMLEEVCNEVKTNSKYEHEVKIECSPETKIDGHPLLLHQAVLNLFSNAIKYSESEKPIILKVENENENESVSIHVIDHGRGIEKEHLPHLLERFYRIDKARSREQGGTGLGLSIVKHIAQAHHGYVHISSELGKGSDFSIKLPSQLKLLIKG